MRKARSFACLRVRTEQKAGKICEAVSGVAALRNKTTEEGKCDIAQKELGKIRLNFTVYFIEIVYNINKRSEMISPFTM